MKELRKIETLAFIAMVVLAACNNPTSESPSTSIDTRGDLDRTNLPIAEPEIPVITELDARNVKQPPIFEVKAPQGAPNVKVILLDNFGYAGSKTFGGVMNMPTLERLANNGLIYNNFHTAPLCSPTRVALMTGHNPHSANMGAISEFATSYPGATSVLPNRRTRYRAKESIKMTPGKISVSHDLTGNLMRLVTHKITSVTRIVSHNKTLSSLMP